MEIMNDTIYCETNETYFEKERTGMKPNTVRKLDDPGIINKIWQLKYIGIKSEDNVVFSRTITDISFFDDYMIISWDKDSNGMDNKQQGSGNIE